MSAFCTVPLQLLHIEDTVADFLLVQRYLRKEGLEADCRQVNSEDELERNLQAGGWDVLLSDFHVPGIDMQKKLAEIHQRFPLLPIIIVSGTVGEDMAVDLLKQGVWDFVIKDRLGRLAPSIKRAVEDVSLERRRLQADARVRASERWVIEVLESIQDTILVIDQQGSILYVNQRVESMFGYAPVELEGQSIELLVPEASRDRHVDLRSGYLQRLSARTMGKGIELSAQLKDGGRLPVEVSLSPLTRLGGQQVIATVRDITERRQSEQALHEYQENLEQQVSQRTSELEAAKLEAERLSRVKDTFLTTMSHEIRTPMNAMLGMLELLGYQEPPAVQARRVQVAQETGTALLRIIDDILDYSRIEAGKLSIQPAPASIREVVELTCNFFRSEAEQKGLEFVCHVAPDISPLVEIDAMRLRQILNNFLSNAIKFTDSGRVELNVELLDRHDRVERIRFTVSDTGIGISAEAQQRLFQPFTQAEADTGRRYGGSGLGLVICQRLVDMMGGNLALHSEPDRGTTLQVTFEVPVSEQAVESETQSESVPIIAGVQTSSPILAAASEAGLRVLIVDDQPTNLEVLMQQLKILGLVAARAQSGEQALALWAEETYGLLITDCQMPDMDGYELTRTIRHHEAGQGLSRMPVIAWTADVTEKAVKECNEAGMDLVLTKPSNLQSLRSTLEAALADHFQLETGALASHVAVTEPVEPSTEVLDRMVLRLIFGEDRALENNFFNIFRENFEMLLEKLELAMAGQSMEPLGGVAHAMKGASSQVGANEVSAVSAALELAARQSDWQQIQTLHKELLRAYERLQRVLEEDAS